MVRVGVTLNVPLQGIDLEKSEEESEPCLSEYQITIKTKNGTFDGLQLARDSVKEWDNIFRSLGIKH